MITVHKLVKPNYIGRRTRNEYDSYYIMKPAVLIPLQIYYWIIIRIVQRHPIWQPALPTGTDSNVQRDFFFPFKKKIDMQ